MPVMLSARLRLAPRWASSRLRRSPAARAAVATAVAVTVIILIGLLWNSAPAGCTWQPHGRMKPVLVCAGAGHRKVP
jgi:hypothetical protein